MSSLKWRQFACPIDGQILAENVGALRCPDGHSFDISREGYCNLHLVQQKASLEPGDSPEMVMARQRFLEGGFYLPIANRVSALAQEFAAERSVADQKEYTILDAGCGEGYYLRAIQNQNPSFELIGIDISKRAIKAAARRSKDIAWAVASNKRLPLQPASMNLILSMFGFSLWDSFAKVQKAGDRVLLVDPGAHHLIELREIIYPKVAQTQPRDISSAREFSYKLVGEESLKFSIQLGQKAEIGDLLMMTPHGFRASQQGLCKLAELDQLKLTVDLSIRTVQL